MFHKEEVCLVSKLRFTPQKRVRTDASKISPKWFVRGFVSIETNKIWRRERREGCVQQELSLLQTELEGNLKVKDYDSPPLFSSRPCLVLSLAVAA